LAAKSRKTEQRKGYCAALSFYFYERQVFRDLGLRDPGIKDDIYPKEKEEEKAVFRGPSLENKLSCRHQGKGPIFYTAAEAKSG